MTRNYLIKKYNVFSSPTYDSTTHHHLSSSFIMVATTLAIYFISIYVRQYDCALWVLYAFRRIGEKGNDGSEKTVFTAWILRHQTKVLCQFYILFLTTFRTTNTGCSISTSTRRDNERVGVATGILRIESMFGTAVPSITTKKNTLYVRLGTIWDGKYS